MSATFRAAATELLIVFDVSGAVPGWLAVAATEPPAPFRPTKPKRRPRTVITAGFRASARVLPAPTCLIPCRSKKWTVWVTPPRPALVMWSEARVTMSKPASFISAATFGSIVKVVPEACWTKLLVIGHSKSLTAMSASAMSRFIAPRSPGANRVDDPPAEGRDPSAGRCIARFRR